MVELKTKATKDSVLKFLKSIQPKEKQDDGLILLKMFQDITGEKPVMWGSSVVGFGKYHYKSERSKQEGDWLLIGFSPRKQNLTLYILSGNEDVELLKKLSALKSLNKPILVGVSRKSMIHKALNITAEEALNGNTVLNTFAVFSGANILRVHDVKEAKEVIQLMELVK